jgi:hypothetical protein
MTTLRTPSGLTIDLGEPLHRFFKEEWAYYDGIPDRDPDRLLPEDVLTTVAVNSYVNSAPRVRSVHRGLASALDPLLARIPVEADLRDFDPGFVQVRELLAAACAVPYVLVPVATKVLHRKRPSLLPMLDNVILEEYLRLLHRTDIRGRSQDKRRAADIGMLVLAAFRDDLEAGWSDLSAASDELGGKGWPITPVRVLEAASWIAIEPRGYYRTRSDARCEDPGPCVGETGGHRVKSTDAPNGHGRSLGA